MEIWVGYFSNPKAEIEGKQSRPLESKFVPRRMFTQTCMTKNGDESNKTHSGVFGMRTIDQQRKSDTFTLERTDTMGKLKLRGKTDDGLPTFSVEISVQCTRTCKKGWIVRFRDQIKI